MKGYLKKGAAVVMASAVLITSVYATSIISNKENEVQAVDTTEELLSSYSDAYGNISFGTGLYVWSGDKDFNPQEYLPDGRLDEDETIEYSEGKIDLTPGAVSPVVYKITSKKGGEETVRYELYTFTAVSRKNSSTVGSANRDNIIYGIEKTEGFGGYVPCDYTVSGSTYESDTVLNIKKGTQFYPEHTFMDYDSDEYVLAITEGSIDTKTSGTYSLTYRVSPVSDAQMYWYEKYTVNVTDKEVKNNGMKVTAGDTTIHASVTDENGYHSEVYMGKDYNLNAGIREIRVYNLRGQDACADIRVLKDGIPVNKDEIINTEKQTDGKYVITFKKSYSYNGYEVVLTNSSVMEKLLKLPDNSVNGGWENNVNDGIITDEKSDGREKNIASAALEIFSGIADTFSTDVLAATNIKQTSVISALASKPLDVSHTTQEYHNGAPTGVIVFDGVQVNFSKSKLVSAIKDLIQSEGLVLVSTNNVPNTMYLNCVDHGMAGYYMSQLSKSMLVYLTAYLRKDGNEYYVQIVGEYYSVGRQRLMGASVKIPLMKAPAYIQIHKTTNAGGEPGIVKNAVYGVYKNQTCQTIRPSVYNEAG